jgi:integrase
MKSLEQAAKRWINDNAAGWAPTTASCIAREFEMHLFPALGNMGLCDITARDILIAVKRTESIAPSVARRIVQRLIIIFDVSIIYGDCEHNPARPVQTALKKRKSGAFKFLDEQHLPRFYQAIDATSPIDTPGVLAFWVIQHTALRRQEAVPGKWPEIDFAAKIWKIPACRMKNNKDHLVPLTDQMIVLLKKCRQGNNTEWIFPGNSNHISLNQPLYLIYKAGYRGKMTIHGARKVFSTIAHESGKWTIDSIELQLDHAIPGVRGIYNKARLLDERAKLMCWHSNKIDALRNLDQKKRG